MAVTDDILERLHAARRHDRDPANLVLLIHVERMADLHRHFALMATIYSADDFLKGLRTEVRVHTQSEIPLDFYDKRAFERYAMTAVAAQLAMDGGDHKLLVEARRDSFDTMCRPWVALENAQAKYGRRSA